MLQAVEITGPRPQIAVRSALDQSLVRGAIGDGRDRHDPVRRTAPMRLVCVPEQPGIVAVRTVAQRGHPPVAVVRLELVLTQATNAVNLVQEERHGRCVYSAAARRTSSSPAGGGSGPFASASNATVCIRSPGRRLGLAFASTSIASAARSVATNAMARASAAAHGDTRPDARTGSSSSAAM